MDLPSYKMVILHSYVSLPEGKWIKRGSFLHGLYMAMSQNRWHHTGKELVNGCLFLKIEKQ